MRRFILSSIIFLLLALSNLIHAQQWRSYNPTAWFDVNAVEIPGPGVIAIGGGQEANDATQIMFQTTDYGLTWTENTHDGLAPWNKSIAFSDSVNGYGVGYDGRIIKSTDAGLNWGWAVAPIHRDFNKIFYAGDGTYYVAGGNKTNDSIQTILKSTDFGNSWNVIYDTLGPWLKSIFFIDTLKGFAVGDNGVILSTTNGGTTWTSIAAPVQRDFNAITFINNDTGYIVGGTSIGLCRRTILRTANGGANWSVLADTAGGILNDISFADAIVGYCVGDSATVLGTTDGGLNWIPIVIDTNLTGNESFNAVKFYDRSVGAIGGKSGLLYVYLNLPMEVFTIGSEQVGITDATLLGGINTHTKNARYSFVYSDSISFASSHTTQEINVQNDSLLMVSEHIEGLTPNITYYYYLKVLTSSDTIYGNTLTFFTGSYPPFVFQTQDATSVRPSSANLNGLINKFPEPVNLFFEYGTSPAFGAQVQANPSSVNDTLIHNIQVSITGLRANSRYFFRLKGVTGTRTYYGDIKFFYTKNLPWVSTGNATNITLTTAQLNGAVNALDSHAAIKFDYGLTSFYGAEVIATPDSAFANNNVYAISSLTGLSPFTTYHFRIKAINSNGMSYGEDMAFTTGGPLAVTFPASNVGVLSAKLNGAVNANGLTTMNKFEYGLTTNYGIEVSAIPDSATGTNMVNISCQLNGLSQNTNYHFRVKAINAIGIANGSDNTFQTHPANPSVQTKMATEITHNSARLNAIVNPKYVPVIIKFDVGLTASYGSEINAIPASASDSADLNVYTELDSLISNTYYHFRIKAIIPWDTVFGNDMIFFTGHTEIPNFDFESWNTPDIDFPDGWTQGMGLITKYSPGCSGNYAIKIQNSPDGRMGVVTIGSVGEAISGGMPFNARPDSIMGCFNYNIDINDTSWIGIIFKKNGNPIAMSIKIISGNSGGNFVNLKFPILYDTSDSPDSLIFVLSCSNFNQKTHPPGSWLIADDIHFTGTTQNIPNNDFEQWHNEQGLDLAGWNYKGRGMIPQDTLGSTAVTRSIDAEHSNYAALIKTFIVQDGFTSGNLYSGNDISDKFPVNARHQSLTGFYKFFPSNNDTMSIWINMFKNGANIGTGSLFQENTVGNYSPFIVDISYNSSEIPDSTSIMLSSYKTWPPLGSSVLYIDNLNFDGFLSGVKEPAITSTGNFDFNIYPNPFNDQATVSFTMNQDEHVIVRLFDLSGKQVALLADSNRKAGNHKLDLSAQALQKGFYICVINTGNQVLSRKLIVY